MAEAQPNRSGKAFDRSESWPGIRHFLAVVFGQRAEGEALAYRTFVLRMDVIGIAGVDGHCQARVANARGREGLRFPRFCPGVVGRRLTAMPKRWQADNVEGEVALPEELSPVCNHNGENF